MTIATTTTIRVSAETHRQIVALAERLNAPIAEVAARAIEAYRRQQLFEQANADYAALRADPTASSAFDAELAAWDTVLNDALEPY